MASDAPVATAVADAKQPEFIQHRIKLWDEYKARYEAAQQDRETPAIKVTLPDGKIVDGQAWVTTPLMIAKGISNSLAKKAVVAKVCLPQTRTCTCTPYI
jgi:threonyl-tRNA synthetase